MPHLAAGATETITVHYHVDTTTDTTLGVSNSADASSDEVADASGSDTVDIVEDVELAVSKAFDSPSVTAGDGPHSFTIDVTNNGVSDADHVHLTDPVTGTADRRLGRRRCLRLLGLERPVDRLLAGASRGGRHEVDHRPLPRGRLDCSRREREQLRVRLQRRGHDACDRHGHVAIETHADLSIAKTGPASAVPPVTRPASTTSITVKNGGPLTTPAVHRHRPLAAD